ncbi:MmgE/PrpD family protein [Bradyrhizobium sp. Ce-3]|uniref:MmgE/PrpD family protein n=1 Tax=Bradyrhizobium sp. Ce-3 TaxID=2913970 RepID=UPI001FC7DB30|nr:MmgE/PrpD family protein [Bradyrhizobium sp. Ce-3]GKQ55123.1 hypothetical protein BRSPCE3_59780 [Bradyrhizobium sp. Ce-3]
MNQKTAQDSLTADLARQVVDLQYAQIPEKALRLAHLALLDWYAVSVGGLREAPVPLLARQILDEGAAPRVTMLGRTERTSASLAALYNGTAGHVLDYDDVHNAVPGHVTINIAPAVLALAEHIGASGEAMLTAFVAGFEQMCAMGTGFEGRLFHRGWQGTTTGAIAAAAACAKLLGLDAHKTEMAMALGAAQAGGIHGNYGSMSKSLNVGLAAQAGLRAALWAAQGITGMAGILERPKGVIEVFSDGFNADAARAKPEGGWHLYRNLFKLHASCFLTHATLQAWDQLRRQHGIDGAQVGKATIHVEREKHRIVFISPPRDGLEAKFSLRFCLAMALRDIDTSDPSSFCEATVTRPALRETAERIDINIDPSVPFEAARLDILLTDGRNFSCHADAGQPAEDVAALADAVENKARRLLHAIPEPEREALIEKCRDLALLRRAAELHPTLAREKASQ